MRVGEMCRVEVSKGEGWGNCNRIIKEMYLKNNLQQK